MFINSVGEGGIWITNKNGTLESGDYVTTSTIPGYGVKQEDDILHNYTVAKITMNCNFNPTLQKVKRIKKKPVDVQYWVHVSNVSVTKEQYDELQPEFRRIIQDADGNDIYQTLDAVLERSLLPIADRLSAYLRLILMQVLPRQLQIEFKRQFQTTYQDLTEIFPRRSYFSMICIPPSSVAMRVTILSTFTPLRS